MHWLNEIHAIAVILRDVAIILAGAGGAIASTRWAGNRKIQQATGYLTYVEKLADWAVQATEQWASSSPITPLSQEKRVRALGLMQEQDRLSLPQAVMSEALEAAVSRLPSRLEAGLSLISPESPRKARRGKSPSEGALAPENGK